MKELSLNGVWLLQNENELIGENPQNLQHNSSGWLSAIVPGTVQQAYLSAGVLPHPFYGDNSKQWQFLENDAFWYRKEFFIPEDFIGHKITLDFEGLDTFATIFLNGNTIGTTDNAFVPFSFDVTRVIKHGTMNTLAIKFDSPLKKVQGKVEDLRQRGYTSVFGDPGAIQRVYIRRPQVSFGWDFAVRLLTVGIWRNVKIRAREIVTIDNVYMKTVSIGKIAEVEVEVNITSNSTKSGNINLLVSIARDGKSVNHKQLIKFTKSQKLNIKFNLNNPKLWYPHNIGKPNLYEVRVSLKQGSKVLDSKIEKFGIRTIKLIQKEEGENRFTFNINGVNVFCKGANWVPADSITTDAPPEKYNLFLEKAIECNMNMLRVWGGGIYENDRFYNLCDELGIMVWQDFPYSCAMYPDDDREFMNNVEDETRKAVTRLRNHPCIVLWCGNNENQVGWESWGWRNMVPRHFGERIYNQLLPDICSELDPSRPYHPGSPYGGKDPNSWEEGDVHDWGIWHLGKPYQAFEENTGRFISEFGLQGAPNIDTIKKYLPKLKQWPLNVLWKFHNLVPDKIKHYLDEFGEPDSLEEFVTITQLAQAQTYKFAIESFRRRKFHCSGSLFWQYNDPWPTMCWSILDYYSKPKASFFWSKRAYQNILPVFKENKNGSLELWVVNDNLKSLKGKLELIHQDFNGKVLGRQTRTIAVSSNASEQFEDNLLNQFKVKKNTREILRCRFTVDDNTYENAHYFAPFRDLDLNTKQIKMSESQSGKLTIVKLKTDKLARFVELSTSDGNLWFSDNYFDLYPGEVKIVKVQKSPDSQIIIRWVNK